MLEPSGILGSWLILQTRQLCQKCLEEAQCCDVKGDGETLASRNGKTGQIFGMGGVLRQCPPCRLHVSLHSCYR